MNKRPHCAGTDHVVPIAGTPGHTRVVARGCWVIQPSHYVEDDGPECGHDYGWACESCPALPELDLTRYALGPTLTAMFEPRMPGMTVEQLQEQHVQEEHERHPWRGEAPHV